MSLSGQVLIGLVAGAVLGLFLGELVTPISFVGEAFILLLQMTALPFVAVSLVLGLGSLSPADAKLLALRAGSFLLILWGVVLVLIPLIPLAFPDWPSASFFSTSLIEPRRGFDLVGMYIPANPFRALADNLVPAVVLFSSALGLAVMGVERKGALLDALQVVSEGLTRIANFVVQLAPYGVFAIAAEAAGTMDPADFRGVQVYVLLFALLSLVLGLWAVPVLVTSLTPLGYRDVVLRTRGALLTAFATGSVFVVLPILASRSKELLAREGVAPGESGRLVDVVVPASFTFPGVGKLLSLSFVLFAGWISGFPVSPARWGELLLTGPFVLFAHIFVAIPFLLDMFRIPEDTFQLMVIGDSVIGASFRAFLGAIHVLALSLLSGCALAGTVTLQWRKLAVWATTTVALAVAVLLALRLVFGAVGPPADVYRLFVDRDPILNPPPTHEVGLPVVPEFSSGSTLERIQERGVLRVGFLPESLPYVFRNDSGALVGLDVEMAGALARDLEVDLELVGVPRVADISGLLSRGAIDIVMSGLAVLPRTLRDVAYSTAYVDETLAFVTQDHRRDEFDDLDAILRFPELRIAVLKEAGYYTDLVRESLAWAEVVEIDSPRAFFRGELDDVDALLLTAETGSSWTLIYPAFGVAVPHPEIVGVPIAYALAPDDPRMLLFVNHWIELKRKDGTLDLLFEYWVKGRPPRDQAAPRWSVIRNILGWVN